MISVSRPAAGNILQKEIPKSVTVKEFPIHYTDSRLWIINSTSTLYYWIRKRAVIVP